MPKSLTPIKFKERKHMSRANPEAPSVQDQLAQNIAETKLAIEKARLAKLEGEQPSSAPQYTRYEDMPPPSPEERARMDAELLAIFDRIKAEEAAAKKAWYLSMTQYAP